MAFLLRAHHLLCSPRAAHLRRLRRLVVRRPHTPVRQLVCYPRLSSMMMAASRRDAPLAAPHLTAL